MRILTILAAAAALAPAAGLAAAHAVDIAPPGVAIGKPYGAVRKAAVAAGYVEGAAGCLFTADRTKPKSGAEGTIRILTGLSACDPSAPVRTIEHRRRYRRGEISEETALAALARRIGAEPACQSPSAPRGECAWNDPKKFPKIRMIAARLSGTELTVTQEAVPDLTKANSHRGAFDPAFDPRRGLSDLEPLSPGGVRLGMTAGEAATQLKEAGFEPEALGAGDDTPCVWSFKRRHEIDIEVRLRARGADRSEICVKQAIVVGVEYRKRDMRTKETAGAPTASEALEKWRRHLKPAQEQGTCGGRPGQPPPVALNCNFLLPAAAPGVRVARLGRQTDVRTGAVEMTAYLLSAN